MKNVVDGGLKAERCYYCGEEFGNRASFCGDGPDPVFDQQACMKCFLSLRASVGPRERLAEAAMRELVAVSGWNGPPTDNELVELARGAVCLAEAMVVVLSKPPEEL
mgnify:CR=1 FL=1